MSSYFYLVAQLPYLIYEQAPSMSSEEFKKLAVNFMGSKDASLLNNLSLEPVFKGGSAGQEYEPALPSGCSFIDKWRDWERTLRLNLAKHRAFQLKRDSAMAEPPCMPTDAVFTAAKAAAEDISPLEGEMIIDKARWTAINSFASLDYFSKETVYAYLLKLLLIERRLAFNVENGFSEYKSLYAQIIESAHNTSGEAK